MWEGEVGTREGEREGGREGEREREREPLPPTDGRRARVVESARPSVRGPPVGLREKGKEKRATTKDKAANQMDDASIYRRRRYPPLSAYAS